jgi:hypothetical protein
MPRRQATYGMIFVRKATIYAKIALKNDAPKQANCEELAYNEKTTIYTKTALQKNRGMHLCISLFLLFVRLAFLIR